MMIKERRVFMSVEPVYDYTEDVLNVQEFALNGKELLVRNMVFYSINEESFLNESDNNVFHPFEIHFDFDSLGMLPVDYKDRFLKDVLQTKKNILQDLPTIEPINSLEEFLDTCNSLLNDDIAFQYMRDKH